MSRKSVTRKTLIQRIIVNGEVVWEKKEQEIITPAVKVELEFPSFEWERFEDELDMLSDFFDIPYLKVTNPPLPYRLPDKTKKKSFVERVKKVFKK